MKLTSSGLVGRRCALLVGLTLLLGSAALAADSESTLSGGIRLDSLDWSIAGTISGDSPNILSELTWSDVESYQLSLSQRSYYKRNFYVRVGINYAWIQDGTVRDSDYAEDNRGTEWSRSISESSGDKIWGTSWGVGYAFHSRRKRLSIAPIFGLSYRAQHLRISNGIQYIAEDNEIAGTPDIGPLSSQLNSTYQTRWISSWLGCDLRYRFQDRAPRYSPIELGLALEYHWADYYAQGDWNLREDLAHPKSFQHDTLGQGISLTGECLLELADHWSLALTMNYQRWSTEPGTAYFFLQNGDITETRLNEVNWESTSLMIGLVYRL